MTTDATTGKFQLDSTVLTNAIDTDPLDVATVLANVWSYKQPKRRVFVVDLCYNGRRL